MPTAPAAWAPAANIDRLALRAELLARTRRFFSERRVMEVETPLLSRAGTTDPHIESFLSSDRHGPLYLATSPEFHMKRLLAAGVGAIYQITRSFRLEEAGRHHNPEFTLVEWSRPGFGMAELMLEMQDLVSQLLEGRRSIESVQQISYQDAFLQALDLDPLTADVNLCVARARARGLDVRGSLKRDDWLDLLLTAAVVPGFDPRALTFLYGYPASQAALARLDSDDARVARRFELYIGSLELANGFDELVHADVQRERFMSDVQHRQEHLQTPVPPDEHLLAALAQGMPASSGVALGFDRLLMLAAGAEAISDVLAFPWDRA